MVQTQSAALNESQIHVKMEAVTTKYSVSKPIFPSSSDALFYDPQAAFTPMATSAGTPDARSSKRAIMEDIKPDQSVVTSEEKQGTGDNQVLQEVRNALARGDTDHSKDEEKQHKEELQEKDSTVKYDNRIHGLSDLEIQQYFRTFFENEETAAKVFRHVEQNHNLYSLCATDSGCAIVCASLRSFFTHQCPCDGKSPTTITHLLSIYLCNALTTHSSQIKDCRHFLLNICELAYEEICKETRTFEDFICRHKFQQSELQSPFLTDIMDADHSFTGVIHKFRHQQIRGFLAAIGQFLTTDPKDLITLIGKHYSKKDDQSATFLRFLFGLFSPISSHLLERYVGPFPGATSCRLTAFLKSRIEVGIQNMDNEEGKADFLKSLCYLHESQNEELARITIGSVKQLALGGWKPIKLTPVNCKTVAVGLELCDTVQDLNLNRCHIQDGGLYCLIPVLHKYKVLRLNENNLSDSSSEGLVAALARRDCKIRTLELWDNHITDAGAEHLASALRINWTLQVLVLSPNKLEDSGASRLAAALRDHRCRLKILRLDSNGLTDACADKIASSVCATWSLIGLDLDRNYFSDKSNAPFTRLIKTSTELKWLRLAGNNFTIFGKKQLRSLQLARLGLEVWV